MYAKIVDVCILSGQYKAWKRGENNTDSPHTRTTGPYHIKWRDIVEVRSFRESDYITRMGYPDYGVLRYTDINGKKSVIFGAKIEIVNPKIIWEV